MPHHPEPGPPDPFSPDDPSQRPAVPAAWGAPPTATSGTLGPGLGILAALGAAVVGAAAWALVLDYANAEFSLIAVVLGSVVGGLLSSSLGRNARSGVLAAVLTVVACLVGQVAGLWARGVRKYDFTFAEIRALAPVDQVLRHLGGLAWVFLAVGAVVAYLAGTGRRNAFNGGWGRRRF